LCYEIEALNLIAVTCSGVKASYDSPDFQHYKSQPITEFLLASAEAVLPTLTLPHLAVHKERTLQVSVYYKQPPPCSLTTLHYEGEAQPAPVTFQPFSKFVKFSTKTSTRTEQKD
jgi:hypothetical protein